MESVSNRRGQRSLSAALQDNQLGPEFRRSTANGHDMRELSLKVNANRNHAGPRRIRKAPMWDSDDSTGSSTRQYTTYSAPLELYNSSDSAQPSCTVSSKSSINQAPSETPNTNYGSDAGHEIFKPATPPVRNIEPPMRSAARPRLPERVARRSDEHSTDGNVPHTVEPEQAPISLERRPQDQMDQQVDVEPTPATAIKAASDAQRATEKLQRRGKRQIVTQKYIATAGLICANAFFIFMSWYWAAYYYVYLPIIAFPLALNCVMIASILFFKLRNTIRPEKIIEPDHVENLAMIMPCYNETLDECTKSLDSLVDQVGIEDNKRGIMVVCDGRVRGPGMQKTTADYLMEDIFVDQTHREKIKKAYQAWDGQFMDIEICKGYYKSVPFYCIVKEQNQGKRDSLIVIRSFLYKFNVRASNPTSIFSPYFHSSMSTWLERDVGADQIDHLIGMDADTVFDKNCISHLLKESRYPNTVGVCGYVAVDFSGGNWNPWSLYQNAEYTIAQGLRRLHQSIATKKVSCLPGCCQLLKICEYTCGDRVLVEKFGYHPAPVDNMVKQILATASEDRNHVCLMLTTHSKAQTRQALRAKAFTDVPHSWSVFLSQRRRWSLGATSNDLVLVLSKKCQWFERILAFCNVLVWGLNIFIVASIGCMIVAFMSQPWWIILAFAGIMIVPLTYYVLIVTWLPQTMRERMQYLAGLAMFVVCGPFLNIFVMIFAVHNMDSFGWGKTRLVVPDNVKEQMAEKNPPAGLPGQQTESSGSSSDVSPGKLTEKNGRQDEEATVGMATVGRPAAAHISPASRN